MRAEDVAGLRIDIAGEIAEERPAVRAALSGDSYAVSRALEEESIEREKDRIYWEPLRQELEKLRRNEGAFDPAGCCAPLESFSGWRWAR